MLDPDVADAVASAMKDWALEKGATHYAHVFYPLTGLTAEKHDSFFEPVGDGSSLAEFAGKTLVQGEPDASSFPNGGLRNTFEARGYTGWDVTSPAYILENPNGNTLCIPTVFVSMTGEALDHKTPLLRSQQAMGEHAGAHPEALRARDPARSCRSAVPSRSTSWSTGTSSWPGPDLLNAGRTLFGTKPPKGQEFDDHYFGAIPDRVLGFMMDTERELFKLGIPAKTRHNEVAPGQFEIAPMFERGNVAADHQQLLMTTFKTIAKKHGMECLFHEKPFAGVNGSGKHVNFSLGNADLGILLVPGDTPHDNAQFLVFCAAVIRAVHKYAGLLRASVASATNDHRLGANEAPPAIISIFLGDQLADVFEQIAKGAATSSKGKGTHAHRRRHAAGAADRPGRPQPHQPVRLHRQPVRVPRAGLDADGRRPDDRRSTRSWPTRSTTSPRELETAVARRHRLRHRRAGPAHRDHHRPRQRRVQRRRLLRRVADRGRSSAAWPTCKTTLDALPELITDSAMELFERYRVFNHREMHSRYEIGLEQYALTIGVEARLTLEIGTTAILPAAVKHQTEIALNIGALKAAGVEADTAPLDEVSVPLAALRAGLAALRAALKADVGHSALARGRARPGRAAAGDGRRPGGRRRARGARRRRPLAAADLPGDALHPVMRRA